MSEYDSAQLQNEFNKQTKKDFKEILTILRNLNNEVKDLKIEMNNVKQDMLSGANNDTVNKLSILEKKLNVNDEISKRTSILVKSIQDRTDQVVTDIQNINNNIQSKPEANRAIGKTRAVDTSELLESNIVQYIEFHADKKINSRFEGFNGEITSLKADMVTFRSKLVAIAKIRRG